MGLKISAFGEYRSSTSFITGGVSLAAFTETFLYGLIIPLLPFMLTARIGVRPEDVQTSISLLLSVYGLGCMLGSLLSGVVTAWTRSSYYPYLFGLLSLAASTAMFAFGRTMPVLIVGRALQGLSSSAVWTVGFVILNQVADKKDSGRLMGYVGAAAGLGYMLGPAVGGVVYDSVGYYPVYAVAAVLVVADVALRLLMKVPTSAAGKQQQKEPAQDAAPAEAPTETTSLLDPPPQEVPAGETRKSRSPMLMLLTSPRLFTGLLACFTEHAIITGLESMLPIHAATSLHWRSSTISLAFLVFVIPTLFSPLVGRLSDRLGATVVSSAGLALAAPGLIGIGFVKEPTKAMIALLFVTIGIIGIGMSLIMTPVMSEIGDIAAQSQERAKGEAAPQDTDGKSSHDEEVEALAGVGYSAANVAMMTASTVGPLVCGAINEHVGWQVAVEVLAVLSVAASVTVWFFLGRSKAEELKREHVAAEDDQS